MSERATPIFSSRTVRRTGLDEALRRSAGWLRKRTSRVGRRSPTTSVEPTLAGSAIAAPLLVDPKRETLRLETMGKLYTDELRATSQALRDALRSVSERGQARLARSIDATVAISSGVAVLLALAAVLLALGRSRALNRLERHSRSSTCCSKRCASAGPGCRGRGSASRMRRRRAKRSSAATCSMPGVAARRAGSHRGCERERD